jgi:pyrimidine-nucleoside phosphorylase
MPPIPPTPLLIAKKRDGGRLTEAEIQALVRGFCSGEVADYQMSAFAMAVLLKGMAPEETAALTLAMRDSGRVVTLRGTPGRRIDKHSTGGVGDKVSLCLAPLVAACGVEVPMISGRGLGHTGGTLDKLEAIEGFRVDLSIEEFVRQVEEVGCALIGQTDDLAPADKHLYALRDVTATVESVPLITASILSKKLAAGIDGLVLDVKVGRAAFMKTLDEARELARSLVRVGRKAGKRVTAILTRMDAPLGRAVGNALETREALEVLRGGGPGDLKEITFVLGAEMLRLAGLARSEAAARQRLQAALDDGSAAAVMREIVGRQGGDPAVVDDPSRLPAAPLVRKVKASRAGFVKDIDGLDLGLAAVDLGAGRSRADQAVDPRVGVVIRAPVGTRVEEGQLLAEVHLAQGKGGKAHVDRVRAAFTVAARPPRLRALVLDVLRR